MYRVLMVPLDGSGFGRHAIPWALALAKPVGGVVHLVHVMRPDGVEALNAILLDPDIARDHRGAQEEALGDLAHRLSIGTGVSFVSAIADGDPVGQLVEYAVSNAVEIVVMSTHGRGGFGRALLGSVSDGVIRHGPVPVLLVRPHAHDPEEHEPPAVSDVLVPLDGTPEGEQIIDHAIEICALTVASCVLLHVDVPVLVNGIIGAGNLAATWNMRSEQADAADHLARVMDRFAQLADRFVRRSIPVSTAVVDATDPASGILTYCHDHPTSLIAMTTHALHGIDRALFGSTATTLIRQTRLPLLVLRRGAGQH